MQSTIHYLLSLPLSFSLYSKCDCLFFLVCAIKNENCFKLLRIVTLRLFVSFSLTFLSSALDLTKWNLMPLTCAHIALPKHYFLFVSFFLMLTMYKWNGSIFLFLFLIVLSFRGLTGRVATRKQIFPKKKTHSQTHKHILRKRQKITVAFSNEKIYFFLFSTKRSSFQLLSTTLSCNFHYFVILKCHL